MTPIGQGGMGRVWRGHDEALDREVAVKEVLLPADLPDAMHDRLIARTKREAQAAARVHHPGIVTVFDVAEHDGAPWIIMELVRGTSLAAHGRLGWERAARIGADLADALAHAHAAGVVHRDLKPDNVLLAGDRVLITDFGIARILDEVSELTSTNTVIGTLHYMAPERLEGKPVAGPVDLWALGATLYAAVEGQPPFTGPTQAAIITAILTGPLPAAPHAGPLGEILHGLLAKDPSQRPDAHETVRRLRALGTPSPASTTSAGMPRTAPLTLPVPASADDDAPAAPRRPSRRSVLIGGGAALAAAAGGLIAVRLADDSPEDGSWFRLKGHTSNVNAVAFSPDGKILASAGGYLENNGGDATIRLWDVAARTAIATLRGHASSVDSVAFSPDGKALASVGYDSTVRLWDVAARSGVAVLPTDAPGGNAVAFSPDGKTLAGGDGPLVRLWGVAARARSTALVGGHTGDVTTVAFSPDGKTLAGGSGGGTGPNADTDYTVRLWDLATQRVIATLTGHTDRVSSVTFSPDGKTLASGSFDKTVRLWDVAAGSAKATLTSAGSVWSVVFSPDSTTLASGGGGGRGEPHTVRLWDMAGQKVTATLTGHTGTVRTLAFSPDGKILASGSSDRTIRVWKL
ncbi:serine/threonine-protein kinase [Streptomyces sp. VNUA116]|uniref:WD40 repeat domain-containing serine/threonine protein kinase n=1 Tax=Streptomyces sp. VNUA116 TaxID=3062449 RepID=UPI00267440AF|nr:serine/threonine-protein kinase [Streptomyces sp. VNUA116]WKU43106.1 serine/threonine-protein kinase [Streptomyces sp. VNUA116]